MGEDTHAEAIHHVVEDPTLRDRAVVEVERLGNSLEGEALLGLGRHGVEQEAQRRLDVLAVDATVLLVAGAAAVIDDAVEHQRRRAAAGLHPGWCLDPLQVRGAEVELPKRVAALGLEPHRGGRSGKPGLVVAQASHVAIDGRLLEQARGGLDIPVGSVDPVALEQLDRSGRREVPTLAVRGPQLQGGDDLAVALEGRCRHGAWDTLVGTVRRLGMSPALERAVERRAGDAIKLGGGRDQPGPFGIAWRQPLQPPAQGQHRLGR